MARGAAPAATRSQPGSARSRRTLGASRRRQGVAGETASPAQARRGPGADATGRGPRWPRPRREGGAVGAAAPLPREPPAPERRERWLLHWRSGRAQRLGSRLGRDRGRRDSGRERRRGSSNRLPLGGRGPRMDAGRRGRGRARRGLGLLPTQARGCRPRPPAQPQTPRAAGGGEARWRGGVSGPGGRAPEAGGAGRALAPSLRCLRPQRPGSGEKGPGGAAGGVAARVLARCPPGWQVRGRPHKGDSWRSQWQGAGAHAGSYGSGWVLLFAGEVPAGPGVGGGERH